ncbi:MAG: hypothetical protein HY924_04435 [Elusimicrobia bacterium]|nr:hypothetical protein [Elusimicrobiota bacterium]
MARRALAVVLCVSLASGALLAADPDYLKLKEEPDLSDAPVFLGLSASLGDGLRVAAPVTFDRAKAAAGGRVYAAQALSVRDHQAVKMSEAVLMAGGQLSYAAVVARRHSVPALIVDGMRWGPESEPSLSFDAAVLGAVSSVAGFPVRLSRGSEPRVIKEGDVVVLDPGAGSLTLPDPERGKLYVSAFAALAAYDGLKDGQALAQWVDGQAAELGPALRLDLAGLMLSELADRVGGSAGAADLSKVRASLERLAGKDGLKSLRASETRVLAGQSRSLRASMDEALSELPSASAAWAARVCRREEGRWQRLGVLAGKLELSVDSKVRASRRKLDAACEKARSRPETGKQGYEDLLKSAGASSPAKADVPAELYRRFLEETGLESRIAALTDDISRPLARRAERIRELILRTDLPLDLAGEVSGRLPSSGAWALVAPGLGTRVLKPGAVSAVREHWAGLWTHGRMAQRKRDGRPVSDAEAEVGLIRLQECRSAAVILSRDPASNKRRMAVSAAYGGLDGVLSGRASPDQYTLGPDGKEVLPAVVGLKRLLVRHDPAGKLLEEPVAGELADKRVLSRAQLAKLARVARVLEGHQGSGVEVSACFEGGRLTVLGSEPIDRLLSAE